MSKRKVEKVLKGVAITGATVGGASVIGDANLVYAYELGEEQALANAQGVMTVEMAHEQAREVVETTVEAAKEDLVEEAEITESEQVVVESNSYSELISEGEATFESTSAAFEETGLESEYRDELINKIEDVQSQMKEAKESAAANNESLNADPSSNNYYAYGDELAKYLVEYSYLEDGSGKQIVSAEWSKNGYDANTLTVTYIDADGNTGTEYFDYVTTDSEGNALVPGSYKSPYWGKDHDNANVVDGIKVVKKELEVIETVEESGEDGKVATVTEEHPGSGIYDDVDSSTVYHDIGRYDAYGNNYYSGISGVYRNSEDQTLGVISTDYSTGTSTISTLLDEEGNALNLVTKRTSPVSPDKWNWNKTYQAYSIGDHTYYYETSMFYQNNDGTYSLVVNCDEVGSGWSAQTIILHATAGNKKSTTNTTTRFKEGEYGTKGTSYYSEDDFNKSKEKYQQQKEEVASISESLSELVSQSGSFSHSASESAVASTSVSDSESESASEAASVSDRESTSSSESVSDRESASTSESVSDRESTSSSESVSKRESTSSSESISNRESTSSSESISESKSISDSESISESKSISDSESISESESVSDRESTSTSESVSDRESTSSSESVSDSESTSSSESVSDRESTSSSESVSDSESISNSESISDSESISESESISDSESISESESQMISESASEEAAASQSVVASETVEVSEDYIEVEDEPETIEVVEYNEIIEQPVNSITDEHIPLSVVLDEETEEMQQLERDIVEIEEPEISKSGFAGKSKWYMVLLAMSALTSKVTKNKKNINNDGESAGV